jgi:hypothetical protein
MVSNISCPLFRADLLMRVLAGMSDDLTNFLVMKTRSPTPLIIKCVQSFCVSGHFISFP